MEIFISLEMPLRMSYFIFYTSIVMRKETVQNVATTPEIKSNLVTPHFWAVG